jgi:hypothetical protein
VAEKKPVDQIVEEVFYGAVLMERIKEDLREVFAVPNCVEATKILVERDLVTVETPELVPRGLEAYTTAYATFYIPTKEVTVGDATAIYLDSNGKERTLARATIVWWRTQGIASTA